MSHDNQASALAAAIEKALRQLTNEVSGMLGIIEPQMREAAGHTNVNVLQLRVAEAKDVLALLAGVSADTQEKT